MNKRGFSILGLIVVLIVSLIVIILMGVVVYSFNLVDSSLSELDFEIGNTSYSETYNETLKIGVDAARTTMPQTIATGVLLGMILVLILIGYYSRKLNRVWVVFDIFVIICCEIFAVLISESFRTFVNSSPEFLEIYTTTLSTQASYVLSLPTFVPIIGVAIMLSTYVLNRMLNEPNYTNESGGFQ